MKRFLYIVSSLVLSLLVFAFPSGRMLYALTDFEKSTVNLDTVWYVPLNGRPCSIDAPVSLSGSDNIQIAFNYLVAKGLSPYQAAGIVGNLVAESGVNPQKVEIAYSAPPHLSATVPPDVNSKGQPGYGLAQWTGGRKDGLRNFAAANGGGEGTMATQLGYLWSELSGPYKTSVLDPLKASTTLEEAATIVLLKFERPAVPNTAQRIGFAQGVLAQVGGSAGSPSAPSVPPTACPGALGSGQDTQFIDGFTIYSQYDPAWKDLPYASSTIGESGCGPSAMAMIVTNLTGTKVTPPETATFAASQNLYVPGVGSSWSIAPILAQHWGLKAEAIGINLQKIAQTLQAGGLVITSGSGPMPFTSGGHYIVIRGVTADGKFKVGDSAHPSANTQDWDPQQLAASMRDGSVYAITKQ